MKRALFVVLPEKGHLHPMLGPAAELESRGMEVTWWSPRDVRQTLAAAGFSRVVFPEGRAAPDEAHRGDAFSRLLTSPERLRAWIRRMLVDLAAEDVAPLRETIRAVRPDVVAIDPMAYAGAIAAQLENVAWLGLSTSLNPVVPDDWESELIRTTHALEPARQELFRRHGLSARFRVSDVLSPYGTLAFTTEALVRAAPEGVALAGPSLPARPRGEAPLDLAFADGKPLIYMSLGTQAYSQPAWYEAVFRAAAGMDVALLAAVGEPVAAAHPHLLPPNVRCVPFAPQLQVLKRAAGFITHGGANSVMEALSFGVPLALSPLCNDQFHNLRFVEQAQVGLHLDLNRASVPEIRTALASLIAEDSPVRRAVTRMAATYREHSGARFAAERLEALSQ